MRVEAFQCRYNGRELARLARRLHTTQGERGEMPTDKEVAHLYQLLNEFQHIGTELSCSLQLRHGAEAHEVAILLDGLTTEPYCHI